MADMKTDLKNAIEIYELAESGNIEDICNYIDKLSSIIRQFDCSMGAIISQIKTNYDYKQMKEEFQ